MDRVRGRVEPRIRGVVCACVLVLSIMACGTSATNVGDTLDARVFLSHSVEGRTLVPGTRIRLTFRDGRVGAQLGCNSLGAGYEIVNERLRLAPGGMSTTDIGCDPPLHAQDEWFAEFLGSRPLVALDRSRMTLSSTSTVLEFFDRRVADPDRPLIGTPWRVDTVFNGDVASSVPTTGEVTLLFRDDATLVVTAAGCTAATVGYEVARSGESLQFGDFVVDDIGCPEPWDAALRVLRKSLVGYSIEADRLTLDAGDLGLGARAV